METPAPSLADQLRTAFRAVAFVAAVTAYVWAVGWVFATIQFATARLPGLATAQELSAGVILSRGLASTLLMLGVTAAGCALAYFSSARKWDVNGQDWHDIVNHGVVKAANLNVQERGRRQRQRLTKQAERARRAEQALRTRQVGFIASVPARVERRAESKPTGTPKKLEAAPRVERAVRLIAGFNIMVLSALIALVPARYVGPLFQVRPWAGLADWIGVFGGVVVFFLAREVLTSINLLRFPRLQWLIWAIVAAATVFASAPVGLLVLTGVALATLGRRLAKLQPSGKPVVRSALLAVLLGITTLLGAAYSATPPVVLPEVVVSTATGDLTGGMIARQDVGIYLATCTALADATSTDERVQFVPAKDILRVRVGGASDYIDSGERPSLARLALHALGLGANPPTLFSAALHARQPTCAGAGPAAVSNGVSDPRLGAGVLAGPPIAVPRANDGEAAIRDDGHTPKAIATLARKFQPTLLVTAADRNWPVSVNAVLAERGPAEEQACLVRASGARTCPATAKALIPTGATSSDYLQLPVALGRDRSPAGQFQALLRGQFQSSGSLHEWLADPGRLNPWYSAQIYFFYAGPIDSMKWPKKAFVPGVPSGLIALEYWFYYPFNYYPVVVDSGLMNEAPIAGDRANIDLHQGDWEHVDVLLNPANDTPVWLYMARHSYEGQFVPWTSPLLHFDGTHPVIQAAFGGHPSYLPGCGPAPRVVAYYASSDWLSCGSGRFAFRAATTPLVNIQYTPWACWPGYFGEATKLEVNNAQQPESLIDKAKHVLYVAGPRGPLIQGENTGVCRGGMATRQPTARR
jgi:hypothetical protein